MQQLGKNISVTTIMPFTSTQECLTKVKSKLLPILEPEPTSERIIKAIEKGTKILAMPLPLLVYPFFIKEFYRFQPSIG